MHIHSSNAFKCIQFCIQICLRDVHRRYRAALTGSAKNGQQSAEFTRSSLPRLIRVAGLRILALMVTQSGWRHGCATMYSQFSGGREAASASIFDAHDGARLRMSRLDAGSLADRTSRAISRSPMRSRRTFASGRLAPSDRLPPQRKLARRLDIDFTTVARGYVEAQKRGLIESRVGQGTFVRASAKRRARPDGPPSGDRRPLDEPAARAGRSGAARSHAGRPGGARPGSRLSDALSGLRRRAGRQGCGVELAEPPRAGSAAGSAVHLARRTSRAARHPRHPREGGRRRPVGGADLSGHPLDRGAARTEARRPADGRGRHRRRRLRRCLQAVRSQGALSQSDAAQSHDPHDLRAAADGDRRGRAALRRPDHRGRPLRLSADQTDRRRLRRSRPTSPGIWPVSPSASVPGCGSPTSWFRTLAPAGCSLRRCAPRP